MSPSTYRQPSSKSSRVIRGTNRRRHLCEIRKEVDAELQRAQLRPENVNPHAKKEGSEGSVGTLAGEVA